MQRTRDLGVVRHHLAVTQRAKHTLAPGELLPASRDEPIQSATAASPQAQTSMPSRVLPTGDVSPNVINPIVWARQTLLRGVE